MEDCCIFPNTVDTTPHSSIRRQPQGSSSFIHLRIDLGFQGDALELISWWRIGEFETCGPESRAHNVYFCRCVDAHPLLLYMTRIRRTRIWAAFLHHVQRKIAVSACIDTSLSHSANDPPHRGCVVYLPHVTRIGSFLRTCHCDSAILPNICALGRGVRLVSSLLCCISPTLDCVFGGG